MGWVSILLICSLVTYAILSTYFMIRFGMLVLKVQDALEESIDILDNRYASISQILETPLFYNSPEVRRVLNDIGKSRDAILIIANILTKIDHQDELDEDVEDMSV